LLSIDFDPHMAAQMQPCPRCIPRAESETVPPRVAAQASMAFWMAGRASPDFFPVAPKSFTLKTGPAHEWNTRAGENRDDEDFEKDL